MKKKSLLVFFIVAVTASNAVGLDLGLSKEDGGQPGNFLNYGASARSLGMGRAYTALADDATASYWNPSGLAQIERTNVVALYSVLQENSAFGTLNFARPTLDYGVFDASLISLNSGKFEKRVADTTSPVGTYSLSDAALLLSHGYRWAEKWSTGASLKVINEKIDTFSDTSYGADVGAMWRALPKLQIGLMVQNLWAPAIKLQSNTETFPRELRLGFKYQATPRWVISTDFNRMERATTKFNVGTEWHVGEILALRAGLNDTEVTAGLGFKFTDWSLDYALGYQQTMGGANSLGASHQIGFSLYFGPKIADSGFSLRWQRKGKLVLELLREKMSAKNIPIPSEIEELVRAAQDVIVHQGYTRAQDLYMSQGYISYFKGEYERSVQSLTEALAIDPTDNDLANHLKIARKRMTDVQTQHVVSQEMKSMKDFYGKGDFPSAASSCHKVLGLVPDHVEALAYLDEVEKRINEPIDRELKIAKTKFEQEEFLDAIKHLNTVKQLDPKNAEADQMMNASIQALDKKAGLQSRERPRISAEEKPNAYEGKADPNKSRQLYSQGLLLYSRGKLKDAVAMWEKAVKLDTENQLARNAFNRGQAELQETQIP